MTDENNHTKSTGQQLPPRLRIPLEQPHRPIPRGANRFEALNQAHKANALLKAKTQLHTKQLFTMTLIATTTERASMETKASDEQQFLIELIFKPLEPGLKLRPAETQLLLAYIGEILKEVEEEENLFTEGAVQHE